MEPKRPCTRSVNTPMESFIRFSHHDTALAKKTSGTEKAFSNTIT
jgi:hypothetical protein